MYNKNNRPKAYFQILTAFAACQFLIGCTMYSSKLAPYEPKTHNVREGSFIDLENSAGGVYIEDIDKSGVFVSRRNGYGSWKISGEYNSMGNGETLKVVKFDPSTKTATLRQTEIDRRGIFGGLAF